MPIAFPFHHRSVTSTVADRRRQLTSRLLAALIVTSSAFAVGASPASGQTDGAAAEPDDPAQQLVERFAPIIMLKQQSQACDVDGEPYGPTAVDIVLDNPEVALRQVGRSDPVVTWGPSAADLAGLGEGFFLDFPGSSLSPGCVYERDFDKYRDDIPATVYARIVQPADAPDRLVVQYWFYWYYNDWNNKHESDWEGISLLFEAASIVEALASSPVEVGYSQHEGGERADWGSPKLEREGDRPVVYSSAGSHASYFESAMHLGRGATEGFGCDDTTGPSDRVAPVVVLLPDSVDDPTDPLAWISYNGRWGERQSGAFNGPTGPAVKERWLDPLPWFDELRASSVVIPAGDFDGGGVVSGFCGLVERGSTTLTSLFISPTRVLLTAFAAAFAVRFLVRRTDWSRVADQPLRIRRRGGQILRAASTVFRRTPLPFLTLGLLYLPAGAIASALTSLVGLVPVLGEFLRLAQPSGSTNLVVATLAGSAASTAAFGGVNALVADHLLLGDHTRTGVRSSSRRTWQRRFVLLAAVIRAYVTVGVLLASVVGIPWGIRQLVRYQFVPHVIVYEGAGAAASLRRSSELVRSRWFHTAAMVVTINGIVFASVFACSLLLLVSVTSIPLWMFSGLVTVLNVAVAPLAAIAMSLLYGDAVAASTDASALDPNAIVRDDAEQMAR